MRALRRRIIESLRSRDPGDLSDLQEIDPRRVVNALLALLPSGDKMLRWKAVTALGRVLADLAGEDMEATRVVMRRLMWSLNDESGGIGWGAPEAMAEAMACNRDLARQYVHILLSYIREDGNYLEYAPLRVGALWGVARVAGAWPEVLADLNAARFIRPYLRDSDPVARALAALAIGVLGDTSDCPSFRELERDQEGVELFLSGRFANYTVGDVARRSSAALCD